MEGRNAMDEILLPTDFSSEARKAYPAAVSLAGHGERSIRLVHQIDPPPRWYRTTEVEICLEDVYARARRQLEDEAQLDVFSSARVESELLFEGHPQATVVEYARERAPDVVVLSTHGRTGLKRLFLGSFAEKVVRYSRRPVLVVRQQEPVKAFAPRDVLVPIDFSEAGNSVFPMARQLVARYGATLHCLKVLDPGDFFFYGFTTRETFEAHLAHAREVTVAAREQFEEIRRRELEGLDTQFECAQGPPAYEIVRNAEKSGVELVLIATHGRSGAKRVLLGSVAEEVVRSAPCSVLVVPLGVNGA